MQKLTKTKIDELLKQTGHVLTVEDMDAVEELDKLAEKVCGVTRNESRLLSQPFELCGIKFYPMTVAKSLWFTEKVEEWEVEGPKQEALLFWVLSLPNETGALDLYSEQKVAQKAVRKLSRRLHCTPSEMTDTYLKCVGVDASGNGGTADYGGLVECLLREYGGKPEKWLYETPLTMIETLMNHYAARVNAESDAARSKSAQNGRAVAPLASERLRALKNFREQANIIREGWEKSDG